MKAKILRPTVCAVVHRERLFSLLDNGMKRPVTWIAAPGGAGKSTLIASYLDARQLPCIWYNCDGSDADPATFFYYMGLAAKRAVPRFRRPLPLLTPEYSAGIPTFTRGYFEALYRRLASSTPAENRTDFVIVLDNYQDVPEDSLFHDMIATGFQGIPAGVRVAVLSRRAPPASLARQQANGGIARLAYGDLRFTGDETRLLILGRLPELGLEQVARLHDRTEGWVAGIILMLERCAGDMAGAESTAMFPDEAVFDYFAEELFNRAAPDIRDFLLTTALLPVVGVALAERLTGLDRAGSVLAWLNRHHFFTERLSGSEQDFRYHPLLRTFLLNRLTTTTGAGELAAVRRTAAQLLEEAGGSEEEAARLFCEAGDFNGVSRMVRRHAGSLLQQGRSRTVQEWLLCLPAGMAESDPWLLYWNGICSFPGDLPRSGAYLEKALALFRAQRDATGVYLAWAGIVDSHAFGDSWRELDRCLYDFDELQRHIPDFPSAEVELVASSKMLLALTLRRTDHPVLVEDWLQRVSGLLKRNPSFAIELDTVFCMSVFYLWRGEYDKNAVLLERAAGGIRHRQPSPFSIIRIKLMKGIHSWVTGEYRAALQTLSEGLEVSAQSGVHLYDSLLWSFKAAAELAGNDLKSGRISLKNQLQSLLGMENALNQYFYHINAAWHALLAGSLSLATEYLETISTATEAMGTPYYRALWRIGMAQATFLGGASQAAGEHIRTAIDISLAMKSRVLEWYGLLISAWILLQDGERTAGLLMLHRGMSLGRCHSYLHLEFYQPTVMGLLCATALEERIEPEYARWLVRRLGLTPPGGEAGFSSAAVSLEEWPYPVKIRTFGRFELCRDGEPLPVSGKEQKKPLELLKALIARGGRDVPEERLSDALWPDADGDQAHKSFETTLARLRKLLGSDQYITLRARKLSLDPLYCRVDSLALLQLLDTIQTVPDDQAAPLALRAMAIYKGDFLPADSNLAWTVASRETLKNRMLRVILAAGRHFEQQESWEAACHCYTRGIETDHLAEEAYRRLMLCHCRQGNHADAVRIYTRCRSLLRSELGIAPSPQTTAVYSAISRQP